MEKPVQIELKILLVIGCIFFILQAMSGMTQGYKLSFINGELNKIITLSYTEITEFDDNYGEIRKTITDVEYKYPGKQRTETYGESGFIEICNNGYNTRYQKKTGKFTKSRLDKEVLPKPLVLSEKLCKIIGAGEYEFHGYEEKDNRRLKIITVGVEAGDSSYTKYWIMDFNGACLPCVEENFVNNKVVSKTNFIYRVINDKIENRIFNME